MHLVGLVLGKLTRSGQHRPDCAGGESVLAFDDKFVAVRGNQLHVHGVRTLASAVDLVAALLVHCYHLSWGRQIVDGISTDRENRPNIYILSYLSNISQ